MSHAETEGHAILKDPHDAINGDNGSSLAAHNGVNGISVNTNGNSLHNVPSPSAGSPATPVSTSAAPDVKIDVDYQEQESDVRHEPLPVNSDDHKDDGPVDPDPNSIHTPPDTSSPPRAQSETQPEDVKMSDLVNGGLNEDVAMDDANQTPVATPGVSAEFLNASVETGMTATTRSYPDDSDSHEPPAKRARTLTDAEMASVVHSATPPPASASPAPPPTAMPATSSTAQFSIGDSTFTPHQWRFCQSTLKNLKKQKEGLPFLVPVDPVLLNIPHYPSIIKNPMDFATIDLKLTHSNPSKPDLNPNNPRYYNADEFIADIRLVFSNSLTFNGPDHAITQMGKRLEEVFDKQIKNLPPAEVKPPKPVPVKKVVTPPPPPPPPPAAPALKKGAPRRQSTSVPVIRRSEAEPVGRPKREIHPPPPKDLPYADVPKKNRKGKKVRDDGTAEQLKYCGKILQELHRKQHYQVAGAFYEPVDWQKMDLPSYPKVVKKPMDMSTIRKKLDNGDYHSSQNFYDDFKLMIRNCFLFNPTGTPVNLAGQELQRLFDEKWKNLPPLRVVESEEEEEEFGESEEDDRQRKIAALERKKAEIQAEIETLRNPPKEKKERGKKERAPVASSSKPSKHPKGPSKKNRSKRLVTDDDVLTFDQKKDLSEAIGRLDGQRLERVIQIIHEGVPEIRDSTEEIEIEIDVLPPPVLTKLYNYVLRPLRQPTHPKRARSGKGTGTGGLKRKSMDEEKEAEKIRQLEERMALFEPGGVPPPVRQADSDRSSDSTSGSESSGSDSE